MKGFYEAWKKYGKMNWKLLVQPTIDMARNGFPFSYSARYAATRKSVRPLLKEDPGHRFVINSIECCCIILSSGFKLALLICRCTPGNHGARMSFGPFVLLRLRHVFKHAHVSPPTLEYQYYACFKLYVMVIGLSGVQFVL